MRTLRLNKGTRPGSLRCGCSRTAGRGVNRSCLVLWCVGKLGSIAMAATRKDSTPTVLQQRESPRITVDLPSKTFEVGIGSYFIFGYALRVSSNDTEALVLLNTAR